MKSKTPALDKKVFTKAGAFFISVVPCPRKEVSVPPLGSRGMQRGVRPKNWGPRKVGVPSFAGLFQSPNFAEGHPFSARIPIIRHCPRASDQFSGSSGFDIAPVPPDSAGTNRKGPGPIPL